MIILWRPTTNNARYGLEELPDNFDAFDLEMMSPRNANATATGAQPTSHVRSSHGSSPDIVVNDERVLFDVYGIRDSLGGILTS
jgi:hypothetical protein